MERQHRRLCQHQAAQLTHSLGGQARARDEALAKTMDHPNNPPKGQDEGRHMMGGLL